MMFIYCQFECFNIDKKKNLKKFLKQVLLTFYCFLFPAHIIPGLFLISIGYVAFNPYVCVALITLSLGFNGAATMTNLQNSQDLAPNFAGSLYGIINFVGTTSGFISPLIVAQFTEHQVSSLIIIIINLSINEFPSRALSKSGNMFSGLVPLHTSFLQ